jgi:hypothetical protein
MATGNYYTQKHCAKMLKGVANSYWRAETSIIWMTMAYSTVTTRFHIRSSQQQQQHNNNNIRSYLWTEKQYACTLTHPRVSLKLCQEI